MRLSLVVFFCLLIAVVHSATTRRVATAAGRGTTKAPVKKSAYAYLRSIRGNRTCNTGSCPFWERHGRSFAALRCYSREYQDCACLHRMCFSSCLFTREVCNQEMVLCLRQICPRCMPPSSLPMCSVYDSMAERVADALSVFACYPCCPPMMPNQPGGSNSSMMMTTVPMISTPTTTIVAASSTTGPVPTEAITTAPPSGEGQSGPQGETTTPAATATNSADPNIGIVFPGSGGVAAQSPAPSNGEVVPSRNQRVQATVRTTKRLVTTRRASATTRRPATPTAAVRNNNNNKIKASARTTRKPATTKKVQATIRPKS